LVRNDLERWVKEVELDPSARSIWLHLNFPRQPILLCGTYGESSTASRKAAYMRGLINRARNSRIATLIVGDINQYESVGRDTWHAKQSDSQHAERFPLFNELLGLGMIDCFLLHNPASSAFTWRRLENEECTAMSRVDHILAADALAATISDCTVGNFSSWGPGFDHAPISAMLDASACGIQVAPPASAADRTPLSPENNPPRIDTKPPKERIDEFKKATKEWCMSPEGVEARKLMEALKSDLPADGEDDGIVAQLDDALVKALNSLARLVLGEKTAPVSDRPPPANWEAMRLHVQRTRILKAIAALRQTESCNCRKYRAVLQKNADLFKPRRPDGPWEDVLYQLKAIAKDMRRRIAKEEHSFTAQQRERHVADLAASYETSSKDFYRRAKAAAGPSSPLSRVKVDVPAPGVSADPDTVKRVLRSYVGDTFRKQPPPASNRDDAGQHPWFHTPTFLQKSARLRARSAEITRQMPLAELRQTLERSAEGKAAGPNGVPWSATSGQTMSFWRCSWRS
jgi:hypothetical protein